MRREIWIPVAAIVGLMGAVSIAQRPQPWQRGAKAAWTATRALVDPAADWAAAHPELAAGIGGGLVLAVGGALLLGRRRPRRGQGPPWQRVIELARAGRPIDEIARVTHLAQDAVRIVLTPIAADPALPPGRSFRHEPPVPADARARKATSRAR